MASSSRASGNEGAEGDKSQAQMESKGILTVTVADGGIRPIVLSFDKPEVLVGRGRQNDINLIDEGVSRSHCRIVVRGGQTYVEDQGSNNGTYINDRRIETAPITPSDSVRVGNATIQLGVRSSREQDTVDARGAVTDRLIPASVLLCIRNNGNAMTLRGIEAEFGVAREGRAGSVFHAQGNRLDEILLRLENTGLVEKRNGAWSTTEGLCAIQQALELSLTRLAGDLPPTESDTVRDIRNVAERVRAVIAADSIHAEDLLAALDEVRLCFENECYMAVLALAGKVLEICLKRRMATLGIRYDDNLMLGGLAAKLKERDREYLDSTLNNVINIINQSRISAVHAKRACPVPSREQALMVVGATLELLKRTLLSDRPTGVVRVNP